MILRRYLCIVAVASLGAICAHAQSDGFSLGALDFIGKSASGVSPLGALEEVSANSAAESRDTGGGDMAGLSGSLEAVISSQRKVSFGALDAIASGEAGEYRPGPLSYISRSLSGNNYYSSGVWEPYSAAGIGKNAGQGGGMGLSVWGDRYFMAPQWGRITSKFGYRPRFGRMHKGIDIAMCVGDTVCVPLPGVVDRISYEAGGYGNYVVVKHEDGLETRYAHLSATLVSPGDRLVAFQPVALSGNTGNSTGPHLHFETRIFGTAVDPQSIFDFTGSLMTPKNGGYMTRESFRATASGPLERVGKQATPGRSLIAKRTYVVRAGDTLQKIAARAGTSVLQLCQLNFISENDPLPPGTMLRIHK